ncbi:FAD/NAD(P)-binding protein [Candidatus Deianiraea vastatrix]|uniref:NAD(P)/FAD-binding protein n=1 Tax=Candidatus Deianiraea vastatrix TaxID=2163644 RepID=A0A5B8XCD4_9RICK|nr:FAD/NAD(P)-binding protein [Candidatus Deianiraea vastatrix]QED22973.1 Putative NAD(P)/FAD-binding protein [Candidatus Deianiraea vastatrix]
MLKVKKIAIVGLGYSGALCFANIARKFQFTSNVQIDIFDKSYSMGRGLAYKKQDFTRLLNVPAFRMSAFPDNQYHFLNWLQNNGYSYEECDFVPRGIYGNYIESIVMESVKLCKIKNIGVHFIPCEVFDISKNDEKFTILGKKYDHVIYCPGNFAKKINGMISCFNEESIANIANDNVIIFGSGLSMIDTCITLANNPKVKKIFAISRHGRLPEIHKPQYFKTKIPPVITEKDVKNARLSKIMRKFRQKCQDLEDWRIGFDSIRPIMQDLWLSLNIKDRGRFFAKLYSIFSVYRHRMPNPQANIVNNLIKNGVLQIVKGDYREFINAEIPKINCLGLEMNVDKIDDKLLHNLVSKKIVKKSKTNIGIMQSEIDNFHIMSPLLIGEMGEIIAVPELRQMANEISDIIAASDSIDMNINKKAQ